MVSAPRDAAPASRTRSGTTDVLETDHVIDQLLRLDDEGKLSACEREFLERVRGCWLTRDQRRRVGQIAERVQLGVERRA